MYEHRTSRLRVVKAAGRVSRASVLLKPLLNKIARRSMRTERKRKEPVACLWIFRFREHRRSFSATRLFNHHERDKRGRVYRALHRVDHLIKITRAGCL